MSTNDNGEGKRPTIVVVGTGAANMRLLGGNRQAPIKDQITAPAVVSGPNGRAWLCDLAAVRQSIGVGADQDGTLAHWIVEAPEAHPLWHSYSIVLVHLRPMADGRKTLIYLDDATHEIWLMAIDPKANRNRMLTKVVPAPWLEPKNFAAQFIEASDDLARERVQRAVTMICVGALNPDTDFNRHWEALFGSNMMKDRPDYRPPRVRE